MNKTPKVSVVLPVYNVGAYIGTCIEALQGQTLEDLEFIFVDDCGPDDSIAIVEEAARTDARIKVIKNPENMGAGRSRNQGIDAATGEYLAFADPDDWMDKNFYEVLYNRAKEGDYDIVKARRVKVLATEDGCMWERESNVNTRVKKWLKQHRAYYRCFTSEHQTALFRTSIIKEHHIHYGSSSHSENSVFLMGACYYAKSIAIDGDVAYYYLQREDSLVHTMNEQKFVGEAQSFVEQIQFAVDNELYNDHSFDEWLLNKVRFLLRRYDELHAIQEYKDLRRPFLELIHKSLSMLPQSSLDVLNTKERKVRALVAGDYGTLELIYDHPRLYGKLKARRDALTKAYRKREKKKTAKDPIAEYLSFFEENGVELAYLQNHKGSIVFSKKLFEVAPEFARSYVNGLRGNSDNYNCVMEPGSPLYEEHQKLYEEGEICWRYVKRFGSISKSTLYLDEDGRMMLKGEIMGSSDVVESNHFIVHPQETRPIYDGVVLKNYIDTLDARWKVIAELKTYLKFLFNRFSVDDNNLAGIAYDAFAYNCMVLEGHEYKLFDLEFEYKEPFDKGYMIWKVASVLGPRRGKSIYLDLCDYFGVAANAEHWDDFNFRNWMDTIAHPDDKPTSKENRELFRHYFLA